MEQEQTFKVTDKRSSFHEKTGETQTTESTDVRTEPEETRTTEHDSPKIPQAEEAHRTQESKAGANSSPPLPEANLLTLLFSLYTHAQISFGAIPDPMNQKITKDISQAKYNIDLLGVLKEKTQGNLSKEEEQTLDQMLYELRMTYISASK